MITFNHPDGSRSRLLGNGKFKTKGVDEMPVTGKQVQGKWRVVEQSGKIATNKKGTPLDGGGHESREQCMKQVRAINASLGKK